MIQAATLVQRMTFLAAIAAALSGSVAMAKSRQETQAVADSMTLRVYDYAQVNRKTLLAAETVASGILAKAGVGSQWIDCPTSHAAIDNFPNCQTPPHSSDFVLSILSNAMTVQLRNPEDSMGTADESVNGTRRAAVFFNRIQSIAGGDAAPTDVLLGRVMAHEIGHMLLGPNAHSRTGIMRSDWSYRELGMEAGHELLFTAEQSRSIERRLAALGNFMQSTPLWGQ